MKKDFYKTNHYRTILSALLALFLMLSAFTPSVYAGDSNNSNLVDSGIDYSDGIEKAATKDPNTGKTVMVDALHMNPYRGMHTWAADLVLNNSDNNKAVEPYLAATMKERSLGYFAVDISDFSGAYHLTDDGDRGPDAELTESALAALDQSLKNFKKNNMQVIIRFVYDKNNNGLEDKEGYVIPADEVVVPTNWKNYNRVVEARQDMIMRHIEQLSEILIDNEDAIYTVQIGFYGETGECHSTGACYDEYIAEALDKFLKETEDSNLRISARTPRRYAYYRGIELANIESDITTSGECAYRAAIFNDGYLGTDNDWGTFENREKETNWMSNQNLHNPYGGDAIPGPGGEIGNPAKPPAVLNEMFKVHTSYISPDYRLVNYWKATQYEAADEEYSNANLYEYIENHLGYRFVLRESKLSESVKKGGTLKSEFKIENVGFGNLFYPMKSYAYITDKNNKVIVGPTKVDVDPTSFQTKTVEECSINLNLPADIEPGEYKLYLQFKIGDRVVNDVTKPYGAIRLANKDIWSEKLEANYLGSFTVDRDVKITKKWEDGSHPDARPDSLTLTIEKVRVPSEYQEVDYIEADGTQWIDTGVASDASHMIYSDGNACEGKASCLLQSVDSDGRLGVKLYGGNSKKASYFWRIGSSGPSNTDILSADLNGIVVTNRLQITQSATDLVIKQGDQTKSTSYVGATSGSSGGNWVLFKSNESESHGVLYEAKIIDSSGLIHHYIPCYRKTDKEIGVYDVIAGKFLANSGKGTFIRGDDVSYESEKVIIPRNKWTEDGDTWQTSVVVKFLEGILSIFEENIPHYESDATAQDKKIIDEDDSVEIKNSLKQEEWNEGVVTQEPTCTENGIKTFRCKTGCNHTMTEEIPALGHKWDSGSITKKASYTAEGEKLYTCTVCSTTKKEFIPKLIYPVGANPNQKAVDGTTLGKGASAAAADKSITSSISDEGPAGSTFALLSLRSTSQGKSNIKLTWNRVGGAASYVVYGNACGKSNKMQRLAETRSTSLNVTKISAGLKKGTYHKFMVVALDSRKNVVSTSKVIHVATKGGKAGNPTKLTVKKAKALKVGKSLSLKAKQKGKKVKKHRGICYESSNPTIATVNAKGKVTARKKGTCYIYAYAQNGIYKKVKIVVK